MPRKRLITTASLSAFLAAAFVAGPTAQTPASAADSRGVLVVGNAVAGTLSFIDAATYANLGSFSVIPDLASLQASWTPAQWIDYGIATADEASVDPAVGGTRYVDDFAISPDGTTVYVSRGNLDDLAAFNLVTHQELWTAQIDGIHSDHLALSPDGTKVVVSATTAADAEVFNASDGSLIGKFSTGTYPHQNLFTADGRYIYNESIGVTALPYALNALKGNLQLEKVDASTLQVVKVWKFPYGLRPFAIDPDGTTMFADMSYLNGFIKYDLNTSTTLATVQQPYSTTAASESYDNYPQNSAHHGLALSGDDTKLCDVGTIDDYAKIVNTGSLSTTATVTYPAGSIPYWALTSTDGDYCYVSLSAGNAVSVIDYATGTEVARVTVGEFPQRERTAVVPNTVIAGLSSSDG
ncbi:YncE family protein [Actinospica sp. MGRD01-02]|uniref:YncE family protein n=1 Tax=Actinospica acidithermotolerans TaxID=2828514 RepID=A0A941ECB5_9ACTN|nr:YncE family protein [Actinospica acidithermotolerans]MBR7828831.1 YncE family protein [Actinospica acidithermotolerans]